MENGPIDKKVVTKDLTMKEAEAVISSKKLAKKWDSQASQYYVELHGKWYEASNMARRQSIYAAPG